MARDKLRVLVDSGLLTVGTELHHRAQRRHPERNVKATVTKDGIRFGGQVYRTPTGAAEAVVGGPVNGWVFWRLPNGDLLASLGSR